MAIRLAITAELPAVLRLLSSASLPTDDVADHARNLFIAIEGGEVVGAIELEDHGTIALLRYQRRRKSDNLLMMAAMDGLKNLFEQRALPLRWIRNTGLRLLDGAPALKRQIMRHAMGLPAGVDSL